MSDSNKIIKPFLRWAGGKSWFIPHLLSIVKDLRFNTYHEPFLGGGSVFFALNPENKVYLSDLNTELIESYKAVRDDPKGVITFINNYKNSEDYYYALRNQEFNNRFEKAARFIYLNHTSYNGVYRENREGKYNVPYGFRKNYEFDEELILQASKALQKTKIDSNDFCYVKYRIKKNDLVFLDPPYTVSHNNNGFIEYNKKLFSIKDQIRLSRYIDRIKSVGAYYILTNAAHKNIKEIFEKDDHLIELNRASTIGGNNATRGKVKEYIFTNIEVNK